MSDAQARHLVLRNSAPITHRFRALDGLRGAAAVVVVVYHAMLIVPPISASIVGGAEPQFGSPEWWLLRTPLRLLMMGNEAVLVFFVLSGFVLTLAFLNRPVTGRFVTAYLSRRVVRLYVPVWASLLLAFTLAVAVARDPNAASSWLASHLDPTVAAALKDAVLVLGTSNLNSPLWSLNWEVWFSLLLPLIVVVFRAVSIQKWWYVAVPLLLAASGAADTSGVRSILPLSYITGGLLKYLPVFCLGVVFALKHEDFARAFARISSSVRALSWTGVTILLLIPVLAEPFAKSPPLITGLFWVVSLLGAYGLVVLVSVSPRAIDLLSSAPVMFFGTRSFSLYLVHEPIIVGAALLLGASAWLPWVIVLPLVLGVIVLVTMAFYRWVEVPSIAWSRAAGRMVDRPRASSAGAEVSAPARR